MKIYEMHDKRKTNITIHQNIKSIVKSSDALILDIWGVLWDGIEIYPEAIDTLKKIQTLHIPVILLSNAPRRASKVEQKLNKIGIRKTLYDEIISSGEICRSELISGNHKVPGKNYYFIGLDEDKDLLKNSSFLETKDLSKANFILLTGPRSFDDKLHHYEKELSECLEFKLPLISANPDKIVIRQNRQVVICAGELAQFYSKIGGSVREFGKPHREIFLTALKAIQKLKANVNKEKISIFGDGLETDIAGGNAIGIKTILITSGILSHKLNTHFNQMLDKNLLSQIIKRSQSTPDAVAIRFTMNS